MVEWRQEGFAMSALADRGPEPLADKAEWSRLRCSFCGKDANHVRFLAAGVAGGKICNRCNLMALGIFLRAQMAASLRLVGFATRRSAARGGP
jgi:hypothetical protein